MIWFWVFLVIVFLVFGAIVKLGALFGLPAFISVSAALIAFIFACAAEDKKKNRPFRRPRKGP